MDDSRGVFKIEQLTEDSSHVWKQRIMLVHNLRYLDEYADLDLPSTESEHYKARTHADSTVRAILSLSISDVLLEHLS